MIEDIRYSKKIRWPLFVLFVLIMFAMLIALDRAIAQNQDAKAVEVAKQTMDAMGGKDAWMEVAAIRFNFQVEPKGQPPHAVKHLWDHKNGRDHVEGTKDGKPMVAWVDMTKMTGNAWLDGKKLEGDDLKKAMDWAYGRWINDTYWMIMPMKMLDNGVNLKYEGAKDGHDVLHLSFGKVGLTPGDQYWAFIDQKSHLMDRWEMLLQGEKEKQSFYWKNWSDYGKLKLSTYKPETDGKVAIRFEPLKPMDSADPAYFGTELKTLD